MPSYFLDLPGVARIDLVEALREATAVQEERVLASLAELEAELSEGAESGDVKSALETHRTEVERIFSDFNPSYSAAAAALLDELGSTGWKFSPPYARASGKITRGPRVKRLRRGA